MRDIAYEQALLRHQRRMLRILDEYSRENTDTWTERDFLAIQRALQVYIEAFIGMARYFVQQKYSLSVSQSREALDELKSRGDLAAQQHEEVLKIVGFRNVLVHDYLEINDGIVQAIVIKKQYAIMESLIMKWRQELDLLEKNGE
ncbi:type VII toxin-antitoxin system HepT family RNase toxin [Methylobacter sp.]|uniref:type VII toxin-antitoxin system HepT family RNase toxin n=1 Tax=Methylobacter sp. TaxID=2051955 RepID=UPI002FDD835D